MVVIKREMAKMRCTKTIKIGFFLGGASTVSKDDKKKL